jgi:hypothetical protein
MLRAEATLDVTEGQTRWTWEIVERILDYRQARNSAFPPSAESSVPPMVPCHAVCGFPSPEDRFCDYSALLYPRPKPAGLISWVDLTSICSGLRQS